MVEYASRPGPFSGEIHHKLTDNSLVAEHINKGKVVEIPYDSISSVHLACIQNQGICTVKSNDGKKIVISSRWFNGAGDFSERGESYGKFVEALHGRFEGTSGVKCSAGSNVLFTLGLVTLFVIPISFVVLMVVSGTIFTGHLLYVVIGMGGAIAMIAGGKKERYEPDCLPLNRMPPPFDP